MIKLLFRTSPCFFLVSVLKWLIVCKTVLNSASPWSLFQRSIVDWLYFVLNLLLIIWGNFCLSDLLQLLLFDLRFVPHSISIGHLLVNLLFFLGHLAPLFPDSFLHLFGRQIRVTLLEQFPLLFYKKRIKNINLRLLL